MSAASRAGWAAVLGLVLVGCGATGESSGTLTVDGEEVRFGGGALVFDLVLSVSTVDGESSSDRARAVVVTNQRRGFGCEWAEQRFSRQGGADVDRGPGRILDASWTGFMPVEIVILESVEGLLGGGSGGPVEVLTGTAEFDDDAMTMGVLDGGDAGQVEFVGEDCGTIR